MALSRRQLLIGSASASLLAGSNLLYPSLSFAGNGYSLEDKIDRAVKGMRRRGLLNGNERTSWSIYDFTSGKKLVSINESSPMQAASMIKPFVAEAYFIQHTANPSKFPYRQKEKDLIEQMIRHSSNTATNHLISLIGQGQSKSSRPRKVEQVLKQYSPQVFKQTSIVEYIPSGGRTYLNSSSAHDYSRFLYAIWNNNLPLSDQIKHYMGLSNNDRITTRVPNIPASVKVYDKTGSTSRMCGNIGVVVAKDRHGKQYPYTFIGMIERDSRAPSYTSWIRSRGDILREISAMAYDHIEQTYRLS